MARADFKAIAKYTVEKFGEGQSLKYAEDLKSVLTDLGDNPELGRRYVAVKDKMLFRYRYKAHVIFYYKTVNEIFIVRCFGRQNGFSKTS